MRAWLFLLPLTVCHPLDGFGPRGPARCGPPRRCLRVLQSLHGRGGRRHGNRHSQSQWRKQISQAGHVRFLSRARIKCTHIYTHEHVFRGSRAKSFLGRVNLGRPGQPNLLNLTRIAHTRWHRHDLAGRLLPKLAGRTADKCPVRSSARHRLSPAVGFQPVWSGGRCIWPGVGGLETEPLFGMR